jgi:hypothetical protein
VGFFASSGTEFCFKNRALNPWVEILAPSLIFLIHTYYSTRKALEGLTALEGLSAFVNGQPRLFVSREKVINIGKTGPLFCYGVGCYSTSVSFELISAF